MSHPVGLPADYHGDPGAELHEIGRRWRRGLPPGRRAVGLRWLGRTRARCPGCPGSVSRARPPNPACQFPGTGLSACLSRWLAVGGGFRCRGPRGRDLAAAVAVAVAGHRNAGCAGEGDPVVGESPPCVAEATAEL